jgi:hypothetical protein
MWEMIERSLGGQENPYFREAGYQQAVQIFLLTVSALPVGFGLMGLCAFLSRKRVKPTPPGPIPDEQL